MIHYKVTNITLNEISRFYELLGRIYFAMETLEADLIDELIEQNQLISSYAATSIDKVLLEKSKQIISTPKLKRLFENNEQIDIENLNKHYSFLSSLQKNLDLNEDINLDYLEKLFAKILNTGDKLEYRKDNNTRRVNIIEQSLHKTLKYKPQVSHERVLLELNNFFKWNQEQRDRVNPTILSAIAHFEIARIHPFEDGNGRLAKMLSRAILYSNSIDKQLALPLEAFYLQNIEHYFDLFAKAVEQQDLTDWLEFYTRGLKNSAAEVCNRLFLLSGGTIDLNNMNIQELTHNELMVVRIMAKEETFNGSEIARIMGVSRQYINNTVKGLVEKGILTNTSVSATRPKYLLSYLV